MLFKQNFKMFNILENISVRISKVCSSPQFAVLLFHLAILFHHLHRAIVDLNLVDLLKNTNLVFWLKKTNFYCKSHTKFSDNDQRIPKFSLAPFCTMKNSTPSLIQLLKTHNSWKLLLTRNHMKSY